LYKVAFSLSDLFHATHVLQNSLNETCLQRSLNIYLFIFVFAL